MRGDEKKRKRFPRSRWLRTPGFERNLKILIHENRSNEPLVDAIVEELVSNTNVKVLSKEG